MKRYGAVPGAISPGTFHMSQGNSQLALGELLRLGALSGARIVAGESGLQKPIAWVNAIAGARLQEYQPASGELTLLVAPYVKLPHNLKRLYECETVGVALTETPLGTDLMAWADKVEFRII